MRIARNTVELYGLHKAVLTAFALTVSVRSERGGNNLFSGKSSTVTIEPTGDEFVMGGFSMTEGNRYMLSPRRGVDPTYVTLHTNSAPREYGGKKLVCVVAQALEQKDKEVELKKIADDLAAKFDQEHTLLEKQLHEIASAMPIDTDANTKDLEARKRMVEEQLVAAKQSIGTVYQSYVRASADSLKNLYRVYELHMDVAPLTELLHRKVKTIAVPADLTNDTSAAGRLENKRKIAELAAKFNHEMFIEEKFNVDELISAGIAELIPIKDEDVWVRQEFSGKIKSSEHQLPRWSMIKPWTWPLWVSSQLRSRDCTLLPATKTKLLTDYFGDNKTLFATVSSFTWKSSRHAYDTAVLAGGKNPHDISKLTSVHKILTQPTQFSSIDMEYLMRQRDLTKPLEGEVNYENREDAKLRESADKRNQEREA